MPFLLLCSTALAQYAPVRSAEPQRPLAVSGYYTLGIESHADATGGMTLFETAGIQGEWIRRRLHPGLDLRWCGPTGVHGGLVGPTVSLNWSGLRPYGEVLFGANSYDLETSNGQTVSKSGVTTELVIGLDVDVTPHTRWRLLEFSQGVFTGIPDSRPRTLSSGIVLHF